LSRFAQAFDSWHIGHIASASRIAAIAMVSISLAGCGAGGFSLEKAEVDRSLVTSNVPASAAGSDADMTADQAAIKNAVSSADLEKASAQPLAWANPATGSRGVVSKMAEQKDKGQLCRDFSGSRESFDGVTMFSGRTCLVGSGLWFMDNFKTL
jgi:hypothetical protein